MNHLHEGPQEGRASQAWHTVIGNSIAEPAATQICHPTHRIATRMSLVVIVQGHRF